MGCLGQQHLCVKRCNAHAQNINAVTASESQTYILLSGRVMFTQRSFSPSPCPDIPENQANPVLLQAWQTTSFLLVPRVVTYSLNLHFVHRLQEYGTLDTQSPTSSPGFGSPL